MYLIMLPLDGNYSCVMTAFPPPIATNMWLWEMARTLFNGMAPLHKSFYPFHPFYLRCVRLKIGVKNRPDGLSKIHVKIKNFLSF